MGNDIVNLPVPRDPFTMDHPTLDDVLAEPGKPASSALAFKEDGSVNEAFAPYSAEPPTAEMPVVLVLVPVIEF